MTRKRQKCGNLDLCRDDDCHKVEFFFYCLLNFCLWLKRKLKLHHSFWLSKSICIFRHHELKSLFLDKLLEKIDLFLRH